MFNKSQQNNKERANFFPISVPFHLLLDINLQNPTPLQLFFFQPISSQKLKKSNSRIFLEQ